MSLLTSIRDWLKFSCPAHRMERNLVSIRGPASPGSGWQAGGDHLRLPGYGFTHARADVPEAGEGLQGYGVSVLCRIRAKAVTVITVNRFAALLTNTEPGKLRHETPKI